MTRRRIVAVEGVGAVLLFAVGLTVASCGSPTPNEPRQRPPGWETVVPDGNGVYEIDSFCDHGNRVYVSTDHDSIAVAAQDPSCVGVTR